MSDSPPWDTRVDDAWGRWRYERLLPRAAGSALAGRAYARLVARVEVWRDPHRRRVAVERIARWRGLSLPEAGRIFHASLVSEAQEEADSARFMRDDAAFRRWLPDAGLVPPVSGPTIFASLHLGTPVLGFLYLRGACRLDVRAIVRGLDDANPMIPGKRRWGERKVAWLCEQAGGGILGVDAVATAEAREHLRAGKAIFAALDIPGEVASRTAEVEIGGERLRFSSGVVRLAELTGSTVVPMAALGGGERMRVHFGPPLQASASADACQAIFAELARFIDRFPDEWWLWPLVHPV
jgi:hypothetical protein